MRCYNCQKLGHFASECHSGKKRKDEKANLVAQEDKNESTLLMVFSEEVQSFLLQNQDASIPASDLWCLDTGATSHRTGRKDLFNCLDESRARRVKFGDSSAMDICGEGSILGKCLNGEELELKAVLYMP